MCTTGLAQVLDSTLVGLLNQNVIIVCLLFFMDRKCGKIHLGRILVLMSNCQVLHKESDLLLITFYVPSCSADFAA